MSLKYKIINLSQNITRIEYDEKKAVKLYEKWVDSGQTCILKKELHDETIIAKQLNPKRMLRLVKVKSAEESDWYKELIGQLFVVHSESRRGGKGNFVVRLCGDHRRKYFNGKPYGKIKAAHCVEVPQPNLSIEVTSYGAILKIENMK